MKKPSLIYLWEKYGPPRLLEIFDGREDLAKKPEIPQATGIRKKLIDATNKANEKRNNFINRLKGNHERR